MCDESFFIGKQKIINQNGGRAMTEYEKRYRDAPGEITLNYIVSLPRRKTDYADFDREKEK